MKFIETAIYEPIPDKPGYVTLKERRKVYDVFHEIEQELKNVGLYPDEYFLLDTEFNDEKAVMPDVCKVICYTQWGDSEGIYLDVDFIVYNENAKKYERKSFITGKTLKEDSNAYIRMQFIGGYIYRLLMGDRQVPIRYMITDPGKKDSRKELILRLQQEYRDYVNFNLVTNLGDISEVAAQVGIRSMIISEFHNCTIGDDKLEELLASENALDLLTKICIHVQKPDAFEINDSISSCRSFVEEAKKLEELSDE